MDAKLGFFLYVFTWTPAWASRAFFVCAYLRFFFFSFLAPLTNDVTGFDET